MSTQGAGVEVHSGSRPGHASSPWFRWGWVPLLVLVVVLAAKFLVGPGWQPDLELRNTSTRPVEVAIGSAAPSVIEPGGVWRRRFRSGDELTIRALPDGTKRPFELPKRNPQSSDTIAQVWAADIVINDRQEVRIENRLYWQVTDPPSPRLPWP